MNKLLLFISIFLIFGNNCFGQMYYETFTIKYPPCSENLQLFVQPDTILIFKDSLVNNYSIKLAIQIINKSDSLIILHKLGWEGNTFGPDTLENGLYCFTKGGSYSIFDGQDLEMVMESYLAQKAIEVNLESYIDKIEEELTYLDNQITKNDSALSVNEKQYSDVILKPNEKYSFEDSIYLNISIESNLSFSEHYYDLEKNRVYTLIVYYSNEEYAFVEKDKLKYCASSNPVTLIIK